MENLKKDKNVDKPHSKENLFYFAPFFLLIFDFHLQSIK